MKGVKCALNTKPNPNLIGGNIEQYTEDNPYVLRSRETDGFVVLVKNPISIKKGHTYTYQVKTDGVISNSYIGHYNTHKDVALYITSDATKYYVYLPLSKQTRLLGDGTHVFTFTWNLPDVIVYPRVGTFSDGTTENVIKFWDFKLEEGSQQTDIESPYFQ